MAIDCAPLPGPSLQKFTTIQVQLVALVSQGSILACLASRRYSGSPDRPAQASRLTPRLTCPPQDYLDLNRP